MRARYDVIYDAGCQLCLRVVSWLKRLDWRDQLRFVDVQSAFGRSLAGQQRLSRMACLDAMHVIAPGGGVTTGFDGVRTIARVVPAFWLAAPLLYIPGVPPIGRRIYRYIATNRSTTCTDGEAIGERPAS